MSSFIYSQQELLSGRFDSIDLNSDSVRGIFEWRKYVRMLESYLSEDPLEDNNEYIELQIKDEIRSTFSMATDYLTYYTEVKSIEEQILILLLRRLRTLGPLRTSCPRLFISHRQCDWMHALQIAKLAEREKFDYWIDILDPALKSIPLLSGVSASVLSMLTACIIEMAIINCSHVIACITPNSRGTLWQPYEYGRITDLPSYYKTAAAWRHPNLKDNDFGEYLYLGEIMKTSAEITDWLKNEHSIWSTKECEHVQNRFLEDVDMDKLPELEENWPDEIYPYQISIGEADHRIGSKDEEEKFLADLLKEILVCHMTVVINKIDKAEEKKRYREWLIANAMALKKLSPNHTLRLKRAPSTKK